MGSHQPLRSVPCWPSPSRDGGRRIHFRGSRSREGAEGAQILWAASRLAAARPLMDSGGCLCSDGVGEGPWSRWVRHIQDRAVALLGEPGPPQKLTLVVPGFPWVAKVALDASARRSLEREANNYDLLETGFLRGAVPSHKKTGEVLLVERLEGSHPSWSSQEAAHSVLESLLAPDGRAIRHGEVTPWNVMLSPDGYRLLDREDAEPIRRVDPLCNSAHFVLRGAAVARAAPTKVNLFLRHYLPNRRADVLISYESYRRDVIGERTDGLERRVRGYLRTLGSLS